MAGLKHVDPLTSDGAEEIGWLRRRRTTDLGAVALLMISVSVWAASGRWSALGALALLLCASGLLLTFVHRDGWIERTADREIWLVERWWLWGPRRVRRTRLRPTRLGLRAVGGGRPGYRGWVLSVENDGLPHTVILERWRERSSLARAESVGKCLARWLDVPPVEDPPSITATPFPASPPWGAIKVAVAALPRVPRPSASRTVYEERAGVQQFRAPRRWSEGAWATWLVTLGLGLALASTVRAGGWERVALAAALPMGALLVIEGIRGLAPGRILTRLGPDGLRVERLGPSHELRCHLPFSDVTWVAMAEEQKGRFRSPALHLGQGDDAVAVQAKTLGLTPMEFRWFCGLFFDSIAAWVERRLAAADRIPARDVDVRGMTPLAPPNLSGMSGMGAVNPMRASAISEAAAHFPRLSMLAAAACLASAHLLQLALGRHFGREPARVMLEFPSVIPFLTLKAFGIALGALGAATLVFVAVKLYLEAPRFPGMQLFVLLIGVALVPVFEAGVVGSSIADCANLCWGETRPARYPVAVTGESLRYGPYEYDAPRPGGKTGGGMHRAWFLEAREQPSALRETRGWLGGLYLVVPEKYRSACQGWPPPWRSARR
jgi:hypothetical protein